jgi:hypothetical protein
MFNDSTLQYSGHKFAAHGTTLNCDSDTTDRPSPSNHRRGAKGGAGGAWRTERLEGKWKSRTNHVRNMLYGSLKSSDEQNKLPL